AKPPFWGLKARKEVDGTVEYVRDLRYGSARPGEFSSERGSAGDRPVDGPHLRGRGDPARTRAHFPRRRRLRVRRRGRRGVWCPAGPPAPAGPGRARSHAPSAQRPRSARGDPERRSTRAYTRGRHHRQQQQARGGPGRGGGSVHSQAVRARRAPRGGRGAAGQAMSATANTTGGQMRTQAVAPPRGTSSPRAPVATSAKGRSASLATRMIVASSILALVVAAVFSAFLVSTIELRHSTGRASHSKDVSIAALQLEALVVDLETG